MGEGASFALGSPRAQPHGRGALLRWGIRESPTAWAWGPPSLGDHGDPPHGRGGLLRSGITEARAAWARGPPSLWDH